MKRPLQSKKKLDYLNALQYLTVDETCQLIGIGRSNFYKLISDKRIKVVKLGERTIVTRNAIDELMTTPSKKKLSAKKSKRRKQLHKKRK